MLLKEYSDVFSDSLEGRPPMKGPDMRIHMKPMNGEKPLHVCVSRKIPLHCEEAANTLVEDLLKSGVIERVDHPTEWCSPGHFVAKSEGRVRLVTDFSRLNQFVQRPVHPFPSANELLMNLRPESRFFSKIDLVHAYFQVQLDERDRDLTCFLLPQGRFRYKRAGMGMNASGDEFCARTDLALQGVVRNKIVDDCAIEGATLMDCVKNTRRVLDRCREHGITVSKRKFQIGTEVPFAGFVLSKDGVKADPEMLQAIRDFPPPTDVTSVRSFLGLANQLGHMLPDLAHATRHMRSLLKKGVAFAWPEELQREFERVKELLVSVSVVKPFDVTLRTELLTDASKLHGLGFALVQYERDGTMRLVRCGSCTLTPAQRNYATIELEAMAIQYGILKCSFFLTGCPGFSVVTDHKPLCGIFRKDLVDIPNPRLLKVRERLVNFNFDVKWVAGKVHLIADALSRYPVFDPDKSADVAESESAVESARLVRVRDEPAYAQMLRHAAQPAYRELVDALRAGTPPASLPDGHGPAVPGGLEPVILVG